MGMDGPALFLVEFVAHDLGEFFELTLRLCIVRVDDEVLEMPEPPTQVLETLALLEVAGHLGADLDEMKRGRSSASDRERTFHVFVSDSQSLRLENATKDLLPCGCYESGRRCEKMTYGTTLNLRLTMEGMNKERRTRETDQEVEAIEGLRDAVIRKRRYKRHRQRK